MIYKTVYLSKNKKSSLVVMAMEASEKSRWSNEKKPIMVVIPGGSYTHISERESIPIGLYYLYKGYQVFVLNYHVKDESAYPQPLIDLANAIKYIKDNSGDLGANKDDITVAGFSAGGHLAALYGSVFEKEEFHNLVGMNTKDLRIHQIILGYPAVNLKHICSSIEKYNAFELVGSMFTKYVKEADPIYNIHSKIPPVFIIQALDDKLIKADHVVDYANKLIKEGVNVELHLFNEGGHTFATGDSLTNFKVACPERIHKWMDISIDWLENVRRLDLKNIIKDKLTM